MKNKTKPNEKILMGCSSPLPEIDSLDPGCCHGIFHKQLAIFASAGSYHLFGGLLGLPLSEEIPPENKVQGVGRGAWRIQ